jgi:hypothetical protein
MIALPRELTVLMGNLRNEKLFVSPLFFRRRDAIKNNVSDDPRHVMLLTKPMMIDDDDNDEMQTAE